MSDALSRLKKLTKCLHIYIAETPGRGFGIFAARAFAQGSTLVVDEDGDYYAGVMTLAEAQARGYDLSQDLFQIGTDAFLLPNANLDDFVNHSCDPNTGLMLTPGGYRMIALRAIAQGDELTYDYSTYISGTPERMDCACGAATCRGTIGAFETLPPALQARYLAAGVVGRFVVAGGSAAQGDAGAERETETRAGGEAVSA